MDTKFSSWRRPGTALARMSCAIGLSFAIAGCAPTQWGNNQVPDININLNSLKDARYVDSMPVEVDQLMQAFLAATGPFSNKKPIPGCAVGIMENNEVRHLKGYGLADVANAEPFTFWTPSVLGSVSKTWTALAALRLVELGLLSLDDTVAQHLPSAPPAWQNKTVRQLLSHTSGLAYMPTFNPAIDDELELSQYWFNLDIPRLGIHPLLVWVSYTQTPVEGFDDGRTARYSNVGYMLAGAIIDKIASNNSQVIGQNFDSFESFTWRQVGVFDGNLNNGDQMFSQSLNEYWRQTDIPGLAKGYEYDAGADSFNQITFSNSNTLNAGPAGWEGPAGGWTATIGDIVRLMAAIQNDDIISNALKQNEMLFVRGSDNNGNWGLGVNRINKLSLPVYMHDGSYPGYRARYTVWPAQGVGVAVMCNEDSADMRAITDAIGAEFVGGGGIGGGAAPAPQALAVLPEVDENDPPLMADISRDPTQPEIDERERRETVERLRAQETRQLARLREHARLEARAERLRCAEVVTDVVDGIGFDNAAFLAECSADLHNRGQFQKCVVHSANELAAAGLIAKRDVGRLARCAAIVDIDATQRLSKGTESAAPGR